MRAVYRVHYQGTGGEVTSPRDRILRILSQLATSSAADKEHEPTVVDRRPGVGEPSPSPRSGRQTRRNKGMRMHKDLTRRSTLIETVPPTISSNSAQRESAPPAVTTRATGGVNQPARKRG